MIKARVTRSAHCCNSSALQYCFPQYSNNYIHFSAKDHQHFVPNTLSLIKYRVIFIQLDGTTYLP